MAMPLVALGVATPQIDPVGAMQDARSQKITQQGAEQDQRDQALKAMGSLALGVLGGNPDGQPDPERAKAAIGMLGADNPVSQFAQTHPDAWNVIAKSTVAALKGQTDWSNSTIPVKVKNADGTYSYALGQVNNQGGAQVVDFGDGVQPLEPTTTVNTGTAQTQLGTKTGEVKTTVPIDNEGKARDTAVGTAVGQQIGAAPATISTADQMVNQIDAVLNDKDLGQAVGLGGMLPAIPNTHQAGIVSQIEQLQGGTFLQAYNTLKGAGQISEVEGKKAEGAIARLSRIQNLDDFKKALGELRDVIVSARDRIQKLAASGKPNIPAKDAEPSIDNAEETKTVNGKTYFRIGGDWFEAE